MHESILAYRKRRYLWIALGVSLLAIVAYLFDDPQEPSNGGTVLGYTLGTTGVLLILWLTWFGVRKRRYSSTRGTVQGWLSAHVYLGVALLVVVVLHAGFQFGMNVHTVAFALMVLVIASGLWGVFIYMRYPERASANRDGSSRPELMDQLEDLDRRAQRVAGELSEEFQELVESGVSRTQLGSTLWTRLRGRDLSQIILRQGGKTTVMANPGQEAALDWLANEQSRAVDADSLAKIGELSALIRNKRQLLRQIAEDLRLQATMEIWLYFHVPLTAAMLMALIAHIVTVFLYW
ncbi:MAG: hypothetical protein GTO71_09625 [Woeseiaceae bacterium]|nr:hypothetical protein [Woeseiaceae bacterium]NIP21344.1 hypothetical protein [Woeseiaceae bacterium]NIS90311.1 hypothetical protein [Woeseiaceae bacterium]